LSMKNGLGRTAHGAGLFETHFFDLVPCACRL
jgi:hypothetical protein